MACSNAKYALNAKWGQGKTIPMQLVAPRTEGVQDLPACDSVRVDFREAATDPLLLRLTTENGGATIDTDTKTLTLAIIRAQMLVLAPVNVNTRVLFQVRWQDAIEDPDATLLWPISALDIQQQLVLDVEPPVDA